MRTKNFCMQKKKCVPEKKNLYAKKIAYQKKFVYLPKKSFSCLTMFEKKITGSKTKFYQLKFWKIKNFQYRNSLISTKTNIKKTEPLYQKLHFFI
jgi:hypothetical protein